MLSAGLDEVEFTLTVGGENKKSVEKKRMSVDEIEKVTGGVRTFETLPNPDGSGCLKVYEDGVFKETYEYKRLRPA